MKSTEKPSPAQTFSQIKEDVGPARSAVFEILAILSTLPEEQVEDADRARVGELLETLNAAREMLTKTARELLEQLDGKVPQNIATAQEAALAPLGPITDSLIRIAERMDDSAPSQADCRSLLSTAQTDLRPKLDAYLAALADHFEDENKRTAADDRDLIKSAMQEIDNISMSINLISLNASVEAARAGEAGRGFAVIASEIQSLSSDSKKAVDSIRQRLT